MFISYKQIDLSITYRLVYISPYIFYSHNNFRLDQFFLRLHYKYHYLWMEYYKCKVFTDSHDKLNPDDIKHFLTCRFWNLDTTDFALHYAKSCPRWVTLFPIRNGHIKHYLDSKSLCCCHWSYDNLGIPKEIGCIWMQLFGVTVEKLLRSL